MSVIQALHQMCSVKNDGVPLAVRRRELAELAGVVGAALVIQALLPPAGRSAAWDRAGTVLQLALPLASAWTLRRTVGARAFAAAAILAGGLVVAVAVAAPGHETEVLPVNGMVAAAMVWILGSDPRRPTAALLGGSAILAVAFALSALV